MKEITHKQLAQLAISQVLTLSKNQLESLLYYTIEPDLNNKINLKTKKSLSIPLSWFLEHTVRAKDLSVFFIKIAREKYNSNGNWLQPLGWTYHFIVDWATPCHSLHSKLNNISALTHIGKEIGEQSFRQNKSLKEDFILGALNIGLLGIMGIGIAKKRHDKFEKMCDYRWSFINQYAIKSKIKENIKFSPKDNFESLMNDLREYINNIEQNWIVMCNQEDYMNYMVKIIKVMIFATLLMLK